MSEIIEERAPTHPVAPDVSGLIQEAVMETDPEAALTNIIAQKQQLTLQVVQERRAKEELAQRVSELEKRIEVFAEFEDILKDPRSYLPVYIRDRVLIQALRIKAKQRYGKIADISSENESGRKMAHKHMDHMVEVCLRHTLKIWHQIAPQLEEEAHANKV